ncbi:MAG: hypothetical protein HY719_10185 [Planctomycetes bacterium]|nr:hypothetical protein [Planctomycetota bacterium]
MATRNPFWPTTYVYDGAGVLALGGFHTINWTINDEVVVLRQVVTKFSPGTNAFRVALTYPNEKGAGSALDKPAVADVLFGAEQWAQNPDWPLHVKSGDVVGGAIQASTAGTPIEPGIVFHGLSGRPDEVLPAFAAWRALVRGEAGAVERVVAYWGKKPRRVGNNFFVRPWINVFGDSVTFPDPTPDAVFLNDVKFTAEMTVFRFLYADEIAPGVVANVALGIESRDFINPAGVAHRATRASDVLGTADERGDLLFPLHVVNDKLRARVTVPPGAGAATPQITAGGFLGPPDEPLPAYADWLQGHGGSTDDDAVARLVSYLREGY